MEDVGKERWLLMSSAVTGRRPAGRPEATSHAAIEQAAFRLFAERGFDATTLDAIAAEVGVGRRTLFRYYSSKNDIPWGQFDRTLDGFREILDSMPEDLPLHESVHRGVLAFNEFPENAEPPHRDRMRLILQTPTLQAHSVLRYSEWRAVIAEYVARRRGLDSRDVVPRVVGQVSLALALTAYEAWLESPESSLRELLNEAMCGLVQHLQT
jgi:mycofactocin system transcriptional regulator